MLALKFRDLKEFNLFFPPKHLISQMRGKQESLLVYKTSPTFPLAKILAGLFSGEKIPRSVEQRRRKLSDQMEFG